jgi:ubiquinone/menaquinone biosynthesis C-methylase UbiE
MEKVSVLDIGCGSSDLCNELGTLFHFDEKFMLDISPELIQQLKEENEKNEKRDNVHYILGDCRY